MSKIVNRQHVRDVFERGVHDERAAKDEHNCCKIDPARQQAGHVENMERIFQGIELADHREKQHEAQGDRDYDTPSADGSLLFCRCVL